MTVTFEFCGEFCQVTFTEVLLRAATFTFSGGFGALSENEYLNNPIIDMWHDKRKGTMSS